MVNQIYPQFTQIQDNIRKMTTLQSGPELAISGNTPLEQQYKDAYTKTYQETTKFYNAFKPENANVEKYRDYRWQKYSQFGMFSPALPFPPRQDIQLCLEMFSYAPIIGPFAAGTNAAIYGYNGESDQAIISGAIAAAPFVENLTARIVAPSESMVTIYRDVNPSHVAYEAAAEGIVRPNIPSWQFWRKSATPLEHNTVSGATLRSKYTSWTIDQAVAENYALRPDGKGIIFETQVPASRIVPSPDLKRILLKQGGGVVPESEVLLKGTIRGVPKKVP